MYQLCLTLETPAANLALDEVLLEAAEAGELAGDVLRLWEPPEPFVVLGRSSPPTEVRAEACREAGVPILRRASGGAAIVTGPGCLMYALVLDAADRPELRGVDRIHEFVLSRMIRALSEIAPSVIRAGTSDLAVPSPANESLHKFSGNSLRIKRRRLLYHGTILYDFELSCLERWLGPPKREPKYRRARMHEAFVVNLPASKKSLVAALVDAWQARDLLPDEVQRRLTDLAASRRRDELG